MGRPLFAHSETRTPCSTPCLCIPNRANTYHKLPKRKNNSETSALRSPIRKSNEDEIEIIDSDDKDVSGSDCAPLRQTHIRVSPLDTISPAYDSVSTSSSGLWIAEEVLFHLRTTPRAMYAAGKEGTVTRIRIEQ
jgi:hypothetical protein